jgi:acyl carrier protein
MKNSLDTIIFETNALLEQKGLSNQALNENSEFLGGELGIDSLDLATLLVKLEEISGSDPFREGFKEFRTIGELAKIYDHNS